MISVIIPSYNRARTMKRSIDSVLRQTVSDLEVIVVDDCSTDNTERIVKAYKDKRVRYERLESNSGACVARNRGVSIANGEIIAFQDSDDEWGEQKLEIQISNLRKNKTDIDFCSIRVVGEKANETIIKPTESVEDRVMKKGIRRVLCFSNFISTQSIIGKKEWFEKVPFDPKMPRLQDYDLIMRLLKSGAAISHTKSPQATLYVQEDSMSKDESKLIRAIERMGEKDYGLTGLDKKIFRMRTHYKLGKLYFKDHMLLSLKHLFMLVGCILLPTFCYRDRSFNRVSGKYGEEE